MDRTSTDRDPPIEHSELQGWLDEDGVALKVVIYRVPSVDARWRMHVLDHEGWATSWSEWFRTDREALEAFEDCLRSEGVRHFMKLATRH